MEKSTIYAEKEITVCVSQRDCKERTVYYKNFI